MENKKGLHPQDLQIIFGISKSTAYRLCENPDFPAYKVGRRIVIDPDELEEWKKERRKSE